MIFQKTPMSDHIASLLLFIQKKFFFSILFTILIPNNRRNQKKQQTIVHSEIVEISIHKRQNQPH